jgi:uncharacterized membrane protein
VTDQPVEQKERTLVGVSFGDAFRAQEFLTAATRLAANQRLRLLDAVFVTKDDSGHTTVRETVDPRAGPSAPGSGPAPGRWQPRSSITA